MKTRPHTRIFRILLVAVLMVTALPAFAYDFIVDDLCYDLNSDSTSVTVTCQNSTSPTYTDLNGALTIPSSVTHMNRDLTVTAIGDRAFQGCAGITSVTIPGTVATIGDRAFDGTGLTSLTIPASVTWVGAGAFLCPLNSVVWEAQNCNLNYKVETEQDSGYMESGWPWRYIHRYYLINPFCYYYYYFDESWIIEENVEEHFNNNLTSFTLGKNVETIPANLCRGLVRLTSITIPSTIKEIGTYAFANCLRLKKIYSRIREPQDVNYGDDIFCYFEHGDDEFFIADYQELDFILYVPHHCADKYNSCLPWSNYTIIEMDPTGDVNDDGTVNVTDYVMTAGYILEQDPQPFYPEEGDLDEDGTITVGDLVGVANLMLHHEDAPMAAPAVGTTEELSIAMAADISEHNGQYEVTIDLSNNIGLTAMQMDLNLPQGMTLVDASLSDRASVNHQVRFNKLSNGDYRLLASSPMCNTFAGNEGSVLTLTLAGEPFGNARLTGIQLAAPNTSCYDLDDIELKFETTGVETVKTATRIHSEGSNIIIDSPTDGTAQIILPSGMSRTVKVMRGHNVYPTSTQGVVIVKAGSVVKKLQIID